MKNQEMPSTSSPSQEQVGGFWPLDFRVDKESDVPPYSQLRRALVAARARGELPAGFRLPPVRQLAAHLGLATNTVARAYKELEAAGALETRGRAGSFIRALDDSARQAQEATDRYLTQMILLGFEPEQILAQVQQGLVQQEKS